MTRHTTARAVAFLLATGILAIAACGGSDGNEADGPDVVAPDADDGSTVGYRLDPAPEVGRFQLPDLSDGGRPFAFRADPDSLLLVFFGFTNCPDVCPATLANVKVALGKLDATADRVDLAMVTVDPERDLETLPGFVSGFVPGGRALGTADVDELLAVADAFGVSYTVGTAPGGDVDVGHTPYLYGVDDNGEVTITWSNEVSSDNLAADIRHILGAESQ